VLRVPGTLNHKFSPPRLVVLKYTSAELIERSVMLDAIDDAHNKMCSAVAIKPPGHTSIASTETFNNADGYGPPDLLKLSSALTTLDPDCDEETWKLKRIAPMATAAHNHPDSRAPLYELARSWSSGELGGKASKAWVTPGGNGQTGEQVFDEVWQRFLNGNYTGTPATLGTIYHDAAQAGWVDGTEMARHDDERSKQIDRGLAVSDAPAKMARGGRDASNNLPFPEVEPFPTPVDPESLLNEIAAAIRLFIVMDDEQVDAAVLWVAQTWFIDVVEVAPLAVVNAPEKACGKSQLLDVMGRMSARPLPVSNATAAALFRSMERWGPTLLIDETDTFIRENRELKGIINAGHTRANAFVLRTVGDNHEPKRFTVWGAKAMAGISLEKHLPDSTMSRAIVFNLRRKLPHESVTRLRHAEAGLFEGIASKLARFAEDHSQQVRQARPDLPDELSDRAQDNWEPLLAIAGCAGPDWMRRATTAALKLSRANGDGVSTSNELLADIQQVFESKQVEKIRTKDLIAALVEDDEKSWATYNHGKPLTPRQLSKLLSGYGIKSKTVRFGTSTPKGYEASQFTDAFSRYLSDPENLPQRRNDSPESNDGEAGCVSDAENVAATPTPEGTQEPASGLGCGGVAGIPGDADGACAEHIPSLSNPVDDF
jgi:putative DNA primase/helicase